MLNYSNNMQERKYGATEQPSKCITSSMYSIAGASLQMFLDPALNKYQDKSYSLEPDMLNGWRPRRRIFRQIPLKVTYKASDIIVKEYTKFGQQSQYRVIYMGPRHNTNLRLSKAYSWKEYDHNCKEAFLYGLTKMKKFEFVFGIQKEKLFPLNQPQQRLFEGMNPTVQSEQLIFDSDFQSGNLDLVMKIAQNQYDLFMRVDTNSKGHNSWFFFKVRNTRAGQVVKFNICNFHRSGSLFTSGMRPSVFSRLNSKKWEHQGSNISYTKCQLRYPVCQEINPLWCLTFQYKFESDFDEVYFSYAVPYSYSYLLHFLDELEKTKQYQKHLRISNDLMSPGGLKIPLLTITNNTQDKVEKKVVIVTGRLHPGETQGSWTVQGFIRYLCSDEAKHLRNRLIFKIMPMVNVDGVVAGNFRTGLMGLDLNRLFKSHEPERFYEIEYIKELAQTYEKQALLFLDFHGHSTRKNIFIYGPDYRMTDNEYMVCRILPKTISKMTDCFRYYSCIFKISKEKHTTGRAIMLRQFKIPFCYTIQSSAYSYFSSQGQVPFTPQAYIDAGRVIGKGMEKFVFLILKIEQKRQEIKKQRKEAKDLKIQVYKEVQIIQQTKKTKTKKKHHKSSLLDRTSMLEIAKQFQDMFNEIKEDDEKMDQDNTQGDSDCENIEDDYNEDERNELGIGPLKAKRKTTITNHSSMLKRRNKDIYMSLHKVKQNTIEKSRSPRVIIKDFTEGLKIGQSKQSKSNYQSSRIRAEELPQIKSTRPIPPSRKFETVNLPRQPSRPRDRTGKWSSNYDLKQPVMSHLDRLKQEKTKVDGNVEEYQNKLVVRQGCIVNLRIESEPEQEVERLEDFVISRLPQVNRRQNLLKKRRNIQIVEEKCELPDLISDILKKHIPGGRQQRQEQNRRVQILRL